MLLRRAPHLALAAAFAAAFALAGCADPVAPHAAGADALGGPRLAQGSGLDRTTFPVTFTIAGGTCGLATTVTGTGVFQIVSRASQSRTGEWRIAFNWSAHGTATGEDGSQYRFNYSANGKWIDPVDPTTLPVVIDFVDHFNLLGQGGTPDLRVFLHGQFVFPTFELVGDPVIRGPSLFCDPI
jgi:hypothetical protein